MGAQAMAGQSFGPNRDETRALNQALKWSFGVHAVILLAIVIVPRDWFVGKPVHQNLMTISLGGTPGPRSTGTTALGGRTVEQVAPPPKRREVVKPAPKEPPAPVPVKAPPRAPVANKVQIMKPPPARAVTTGAQKTVGNTVVDTGAKGLGAGLTFGGGGGASGETEIKDFCCREYLDQMIAEISSRWKKDQPDSGIATLKFTILRSGAIDAASITVEQSSGSGLLDRASKSALLDSHLPPLPAEFKLPTLIIHLKFPYTNGPQ